MPSTTDPQPINLAELRAERAAARLPLNASQQRAYRRLAIAALGLDVPTLTRQLRARRLEALPELRLVPAADLAA